MHLYRISLTLTLGSFRRARTRAMHDSARGNVARMETNATAAAVTVAAAAAAAADDDDDESVKVTASADRPDSSSAASAAETSRGALSFCDP